MNILLINENYHYILKESCPPMPPANASKAGSKEYNRWVIINNKVGCYLLAAMDEVFRTKQLQVRLWNLCRKCLDNPLNNLAMKL